MKKETFKKGIYLLGALLVLILVLEMSVTRFSSESAGSVVSAAIYLSYRILAIALLLFSIYAFKAGIRGEQLLESPVWYIVIGSIFVLFSYGPPLMSYAFMPDLKTLGPGNELPTETKEEALDRNSISGKRFNIARRYYLYSGERIKFLDDMSRETIYMPDKETIDLRSSLVETARHYEAAKANVRIAAATLVAILVASVSTFFLILWIRNRKRLERL